MVLPIALLPSLFFFTLGPFLGAGSTTENSGRSEEVVLAEGETHEGWFFAAGDAVIIRGVVNGDAYVAGRTVQVDGVINGDLLIAGGNVSLRGVVTDDIRVCGGNVRIDGKVGKNVTAAGGSVEMGSASEVNGSLLAMGGSIYVGGNIQREVKLAGGQVTVAGTVGQNADIRAETATIVKGSHFGGDLTIHVPKKDGAQVAPETVKGRLTVHVREEEEKPGPQILGLSRSRFWFKLFWVLSLLVVGFVFSLALPDQFYAVGRFVWSQPLQSLLWGIIGLVFGPVAIALICITVIGLPLGFFLLAVYLWLLYLSQLSLAVVIGSLLISEANKGGFVLFGAFALGLIIVQALTFIAVVNVVIVIVGLILGVGALLLMINTEYKRIQVT